MVNPVRILTHKPQRKLTDQQVLSLLTEYVVTPTTYKAMSEKYGITQASISQIVRGVTYRELIGSPSLRKKAQQKAANRSAKYSNAEALRVPDWTLTLIEVDFTSVASLDAAHVLIHDAYLRLGLAVEVSF